MLHPGGVSPQRSLTIRLKEIAGAGRSAPGRSAFRMIRSPPAPSRTPFIVRRTVPPDRPAGSWWPRRRQSDETNPPPPFRQDRRSDETNPALPFRQARPLTKQTQFCRSGSRRRGRGASRARTNPLEARPEPRISQNEPRLIGVEAIIPPIRIVPAGPAKGEARRKWPVPRVPGIGVVRRMPPAVRIAVGRGTDPPSPPARPGHPARPRQAEPAPGAKVAIEAGADRENHQTKPGIER